MAETSIKNLQSLLQSTLGANFLLEKSMIKDLLPPGENYGSKIVSLHVVTKNKTTEKSENLYLVGKLFPASQEERMLYDFSNAFRKEIYMYQELLPYYRKLEIESGIKEEEVCNLAPKYYGSRLSLNPDNNIDDEALILLENLIPEGYYCVDRKVGCGLSHAKVTVKGLARFHALGISTKEKDPEFFDILKVKSKFLDIENEHFEHFEACKAMSDNLFEKLMTPPDEHWTSIIHSDWVYYLFTSPIRDLIFFVMCGLDTNAFGNADDLIDLYYVSVIEQLKLLNCDVTPYCRESFYGNIRDEARA